MPGSYDLTVTYEHLGQARCWKDGFYDRCTRHAEQGWWLPGTTLIPGQTQWEAKAGTVWVITRDEDYWNMAEQGSWRPTLKQVNHEQAENVWKSRRESRS